MNLPTPQDPGRAPVWDNYVVAQVAQASLGLIPNHALAVGVEVDGLRVRLRFQLSELTDADSSDMDDVLSELEALLGDEVQVDQVREVRHQRDVSPSDGVRWIFLSRT